MGTRFRYYAAYFLKFAAILPVFAVIAYGLLDGELSPMKSDEYLSAPVVEVRVNLNTASVRELQKVSGIGEVKAAAIVEYREEHGAFSSVDELVNVRGIGEKTLENLRDQLTV